MNHELMHQCRREAEEVLAAGLIAGHPPRDLTVISRQQLATEAYAAALYAERSKRRELTDDMIETAGAIERRMYLQETCSDEQAEIEAGIWSKGVMSGLRQARDNGYLAPAAGLTMDGPLYDFKPDGTDVRLSVYPDHNHDGGFYLSWLQGEERWSTKLGWADVMECLANEYAPDDVAMRLQDQMKSARLTAAIEAKASK